MPPSPRTVRQATCDARREPTPSEAILWRALRNPRLGGRKFRRQHPVSPFILDFYCHEESLAVEIDGGIHASQTAADTQRQQALESRGVRFVRISADLVENDLPSALARIEAAFDLPSPAHGRGAGGEG